MKARRSNLTACALFGASICTGAHCTTSPAPSLLGRFEDYVNLAAERMPARFSQGNLVWLAANDRSRAETDILAGKVVRRNLSDPNLNRQVSPLNGTFLHWIGAVHIPATTVSHLKSVLADYSQYPTVFHPMFSNSSGVRLAGSGNVTDQVDYNLQYSYRFAALVQQSYLFRVSSQIHYSESSSVPLQVYMRVRDIRESDSGIAGRNDFLTPFRDHGILWGIHAWWRARQQGPDVYLEFETITLARSVDMFHCRLGPIPVPKSVVARVVDVLPSDSLERMLLGVRLAAASTTKP